MWVVVVFFGVWSAEHLGRALVRAGVFKRGELWSRAVVATAVVL